MELRIRNAKMLDLPAVAAVEAECFPPAEAAAEKDFAARLAVYPDYFWLLEYRENDGEARKDRITDENSEAQEGGTAAEAESIQNIQSALKWKIIGFVNGMVTNRPDLCDEMYENASMHDENGAWQMIFGVNTLPAYRRRGYAELILRRVIDDARTQGRKGIVLTCKDRLVHYYAKFGFVNEGVSESVHGNVVWYQMRLKFDK